MKHWYPHKPVSYDCKIDINLLLVNTCHVVGTVPFYKYWSHFRLALTVGRCDKSQTNNRRLFPYVVEACVCFPMICLYLTSRKAFCVCERERERKRERERVEHQYHFVPRVAKPRSRWNERTNICQVSAYSSTNHCHINRDVTEHDTVNLIIVQFTITGVFVKYNNNGKLA
jgi:hypothetical protein